MKNALIALALVLAAPVAAAAQATPEECAASFSARLAAARAELVVLSRRRTFVQPRHPENEACEADDTQHRITLVLREPSQMGEPTERIARLRHTIEQLQVMTYGVDDTFAASGRETIVSGRATLARLRAEAAASAAPAPNE